jgi:hypothetical protein
LFNGRNLQRANDGENVAPSINDEGQTEGKAHDASALLRVAPFAPSCALDEILAPSNDVLRESIRANKAALIETLSVTSTY